MKKFFSLAVAFIVLTAMNVFANDNYTALSNPIHQIQQTVAYSDFTDGGSTAGTLNLTPTIPAGAIPLAWKAVVSTGFSGDTSATLLVGVSGDTDRFSASDGQNIFAAGTFTESSIGEAVSGDGGGSAQTVLLTLTSGSDFGSVSAGSMVLTIFYIRP